MLPIDSRQSPVVYFVSLGTCRRIEAARIEGEFAGVTMLKDRDEYRKPIQIHKASACLCKEKTAC